MSIFGSIVSKIFGKAKPAEPLPAEPIALCAGWPSSSMTRAALSPVASTWLPTRKVSARDDSDRQRNRTRHIHHRMTTSTALPAPWNQA